MTVGLAVAAAAFAATFKGPPDRFWRRMTMTGATLGTLALSTQPSLRTLKPTRRDVAAGLTSAAALYGIFRIGDYFARRLMPHGADDIDDVYALRHDRSPLALAARLALVIGPAEELFWRGFVQSRLVEIHGRGKGDVLAVAAYGAVHLPTGNATLIGAATVAGAFWGALAAAGMSMPALIVSHVAWDVVIFLVAPTTGTNQRADGD
ncbi:MAG: CPBP family intramembrane metalloprotease, partial [Actinomycetota bacterium]|nr:CPBP family intramembrane metalloprotease [Actinomycetota bacterium]